MNDQLKTIAGKLAEVGAARCKTADEHERLLAEIERHYWKEIAGRALTSAHAVPDEIHMSKAAKRQAVIDLLNEDSYRTAPGTDVAKAAGVSESLVSSIRRSMKTNPATA